MKIFDECTARKPDHYAWAQKFIETAQNGFWTHREFSFQSDIQDFKVTLTDQERIMITRSLACIGQIEISVKTFWAKLGENCPHPSLYDLGYTLAHQEVIHGNAYSRLLEVLGINDAFEEILKLDIIKGRVSYLKKHLHKFHADNKKQFVYSLILFTLFIENISLFSQFYTLNWFGRFKNVLKDTNKQTEYSAREEDLHAKVGVKLINTIRTEYPELFDEELEKKVVYEATQAIKYEFEIVDWIINGNTHETLNSELLKNFIRNRMNESLVSIGYSPNFEVDQDLVSKTIWFDEQVLGNNMTDFFNSRPTEYSKNSKSFDESDLF
jgi:ribonucleoside-diphosphate reductase beta chain